MMTIEQIITLKQLLAQYRDDLWDLGLNDDVAQVNKILLLVMEELRDHNR